MEVDSGYNGDPTAEQIMELDAEEVRVCALRSECGERGGAVQPGSEFRPTRQVADTFNDMRTRSRQRQLSYFSRVAPLQGAVVGSRTLLFPDRYDLFSHTFTHPG